MSSLPGLVLTFWSSPLPHYDSHAKLRYRLISQTHSDFRTIVPPCPQINFILDPDSSSLSMAHCSLISEDLLPEKDTPLWPCDMWNVLRRCMCVGVCVSPKKQLLGAREWPAKLTRGDSQACLGPTNGAESPRAVVILRHHHVGVCFSVTDSASLSSPSTRPPGSNLNWNSLMEARLSCSLYSGLPWLPFLGWASLCMLHLPSKNLS